MQNPDFYATMGFYMDKVYQVVFYAFSFVSLYVQVFFLIVFLEKRKEILVRTKRIELPEYPSVSITIPAYNESKNIEKTVQSLLELDYPKEKLFINIVDDGSTDDTWEVMQQYKNNSQIKLFRQENGGKFAANNLGLKNSATPFVGCLDADSMVHPEALKRIMTYFDNTDVMAVASTIVIHNPKSVLQKAQRVEYEFSIFVKKMLSFIDAIHVTPGPFSIFRKEVFEKLGPYRHAHNTEDQEIAMRMKAAKMKIEHAPDAYVYTLGPHKVRGLFKQRVRWIYGFIRNSLDYKKLLFRHEYGNIGFITLPSGIISILSVIFLFSYVLYNLSSFVARKVTEYQTVGFSWDFTLPELGIFSVPSHSVFFITVFVYLAVFASLFIGQTIRHGKVKLSFDIFYFFFIYSLIAPFWLMRSIYNAIRNYEASWTRERDTRGI